MKIGVLELDQAPGEVPRHTLSRSKAKVLVHGMRWAVHVSRDRIQLRVAHSWSVIKATLKPALPKTPALRRCYIPAKLPPPEIPGILFKEPLSACWRKDPSSPSLAVRQFPFEEMQMRLMAGL